MSIQAGRTIKIIVVDDEPISADDMSDVIRDEFGKSMNVDVRTAYNAKSVIRWSKNRLVIFCFQIYKCLV